MSSTNKTPNLGLNSYIESDIPTRLDVNSDNNLVDTAVGNHINDETSHVSESDREKWDENMFLYAYVGNGAPTRKLTPSCPFKARAVMIFAGGRAPAETMFTDQQNYNFAAFASSSIGSLGLTINMESGSIFVKQSTSAEAYNEYASLNMDGVLYSVVMFR